MCTLIHSDSDPVKGQGGALNDPADVVRIVEIMDAFDDPSDVSVTTTHDWRSSSDPNVLGALLHLFDVKREELGRQVDTSLTFDVIVTLFEVTLTMGNSKRLSRFAFSDYEAARALTSFMLSNVASLTPQEMGRFNLALRRVALHGNQEQQECLVKGVLGHTLHSAEIRGILSDWDSDPRLSSILKAGGEFS